MGLSTLGPGLLAGLSSKIADLEAAVHQQSGRFTAVLEIGSAISGAQDVDELLSLVIERLAGLLKAEAATLFLYDPAKDELWSKILRGSTLKEIRVGADRGLVGHVFRSGATLALADAYADERFNPEFDRRSGFKTRSVIAAPLRHVSGKILGVVEVLDRKVSSFNEEDRLTVEAIATHIAAVIDNVRLVEALRRQNLELQEAKDGLSTALRELDVLYEVERSVSSAGTLSEVLDTIVGKAMEATSAMAASVLLAEGDKGELFFRSAKGEKSDSLVSMTLKLGQGIAGQVAQSGQTIRVEDAEDCPFFDRTIARRLGVPTGSVLCLPIPGRDKVLGALELLNKPKGFSEADERMATLLAGQAGRILLIKGIREEEERRARLAAIGQMLSGVLHDLRTPMTIIGGYAQLLASEQDPKERKQFAEVIEKQVAHINAMTRETLAFARGEQQLLLQRVYINRFIEEVEAFLRKDLENTSIDLKVQVGYTGMVRADENKLKRVVYNITRNAVQAMPKGGRILFSIDREQDDLVMRFSDNGPGIPEAIADRLFQSFVTSGKGDGTGLGLAIVKTIADEHGGKVSFKSKAGKGTTFEFRIPVRE